MEGFEQGNKKVEKPARTPFVFCYKCDCYSLLWPAAGGERKKMENVISFVAGASYGAMSVVVGQPLDTIKTRMQAHSANLNANPFVTATSLFKKEGIRGLYRGGTPIFVGGALFRSAQFGFYEAAMKFSNGRIPENRYFGFLNPQVVFSGFCGGIARGLVRPYIATKCTYAMDNICFG